MSIIKICLMVHDIVWDRQSHQTWTNVWMHTLKHSLEYDILPFIKVQLVFCSIEIVQMNWQWIFHLLFSFSANAKRFVLFFCLKIYIRNQAERYVRFTPKLSLIAPPPVRNIIKDVSSVRVIRSPLPPPAMFFPDIFNYLWILTVFSLPSVCNISHLVQKNKW